MGRIAGIDLGTTFSALAVLNEMGRPETVPNSDGERITPSTVFFAEDGVVLVGEEAVNAVSSEPSKGARWVKRFMGLDEFPDKVAGRKWSPAELSSFVLRKLKEDCSTQVGEITDVVITVPAYFDEVRRKATMDAGRLAGLNVVGIINEPTAAALYYATQYSVMGRIMVFDLGGGTFDVTLMDVNGRQVDILCSRGDHQLGGVDFDNAILKIMEKKYKEETDGNLVTDDESRARLIVEAETIKRTLSKRPSATALLYGDVGQCKFAIAREKFEESISPLMARIGMLVEDVLDEAETEPENVTSVLLVGGSTRLPVIQKRLEKIFGFPPTSAVNVDECVALGAAIHAGLRLMEESPLKVDAGVASGLKDIGLQEVCSHCYGTLAMTQDEKTDRAVLANDVLIKKNTPIPCKITKTYYTAAQGQTSVDARVTQHSTATTDADIANVVALGSLQLPPGRPAGQPVKVTYSYDADQRMHCVFQDEVSGKKLVLDIDTQAGSMSSSDVERKAEELEGYSLE
ncbi:MAG: Hsp70 family protein [Candidatus Sabulitectum sp.]|nr:Hsp70 family protein [Candidatus Sabulitectum sp.]